MQVQDQMIWINAVQDAYSQGLHDACARLGHQHILGDETCPCGKIQAKSPRGVEVKVLLDQRIALAADALCAERDHNTGPGGLTGYSWREGTCCCDYDVEAVLKAIGET